MTQAQGAVGIAMSTRRKEFLRLVDVKQATEEDWNVLLGLLGDLIDEAERRDAGFNTAKEIMAHIRSSLVGSERRINDFINQVNEFQQGD